MEIKITFNLNNEEVCISADPGSRLLDILRGEFGLTGTKEGCGEGECGACSVILDGKLVNACLVAAGSLTGKRVMTIDGFRETSRFAILDQAFSDAGAVQCGFCTPGMIMAAEALLSMNPAPDESAIREGISGNLCRCTGYNMIVDAIDIAAKRGRGIW